ncbi:MAG: GntR family transcriptional regulator [Anaerolineales bacterium]|nr:GntR family transcriptional regulator [Anaerolineales bacterium]
MASIDVNDLQRLFEMRVPLEVLAVQLATQRGSSGHWNEMAHLLASAAVLPDSAEDALMEIDHACHALFWQAADNRFLEEQLTVLYALSLRMWHYSLPRLENLRFCVLEHHAMLDAVCQLQAGLAGQLMEQHIRAFQENIEQAIRNKWVAPHFEMEPSP